MVPSQSRHGFDAWALHAFLVVTLLFVGLIVADGLGYLSHGAGRSSERAAVVGASGSIRPAAMEEFETGKFSTKEAWFYHPVGAGRAVGASGSVVSPAGDGGGVP